MLQTLARIAVGLELDTLGNNVLESLYGNTSVIGKSPRFQILIYHKVSPDPHPYYEPVAPEVFERQMSFIGRHYRVMDLLELVERSATGSVPPKAVAITFDDGYRDNYDYAFPILKKLGLPATIFVATGVTGTRNRLWHDRVFDAFRFTKAEHARLNYPHTRELILDSPQARKESLHSALTAVRSLWGQAQRRLVEDIEDALLPVLPSEPPLMLDWDQIAEMHANGISIGSHSVSHPILSRLPDEELKRELSESKRELSERLGAPIEAFAYPNGKADDYSPSVKKILNDCGYRCAVTTVRGFNIPCSDPFELKRDLPWESEIELFRFKLFLKRHGLYN